MRKLMFSLVATLAFGSFAMANNVELLPVLEVESVDVLCEENPNENECAASAMAFGDAAEATGATPVQAYHATNWAFEMCMAGWSWSFSAVR